MSPLGGYRPGSGAKAVEPGGRTVAVSLYTRHLVLLDRYASAHRLPNRSAALRNMIERSAADSHSEEMQP